MRFKKFGFSMTELIIVLTLISVVIIFELHVLFSKTTNQYETLYYNVYHAIEKTAYNVLADMYCPDYADTVEDPDCADGPRPFPMNDSTALCERFKEFINYAKEQGSCEASKINDVADNISDDTLGFISSNGTKFYFSQNMYTITDFGASNPINYYIVYVDLNGKKSPNRVNLEEGNELYPDIVPFAVTTRGEVIPMGYPIYDTMYLSAQVRYRAEQKEDDGSGEAPEMETKKSKSYTFHQARGIAWGTQEAYDIPYSIDFNRRLPANNLAAFFNTLTIEPAPGVDSANGCEVKTYNCRVKIVKNLNTRN